MQHGKAFLFQHGIFTKLVLFLFATLKQTFIRATFYLASHQILFIPVADLGCAGLSIIRNNFRHCNFVFRVRCCLYIRAKMPRPTRNCRDADISLVQAPNEPATCRPSSLVAPSTPQFQFCSSNLHHYAKLMLFMNPSNSWIEMFHKRIWTSIWVSVCHNTSHIMLRIAVNFNL